MPEGGGFITFTLHTTQESDFGATLYEPNPPNRLVLAQFQRIYRENEYPSSYIDATLLKSRISWYSDCISYQIPLKFYKGKYGFVDLSSRILVGGYADLKPF